MTDGAGRMRPGDTIDRPRAGQRAGNGQPHKECWPQGLAGEWVPSRARRSPSREKVSLPTLFDRLAKAAAAHDGEASTEIFGESS
jgi:hypothetical protein